MKEKIFSLLLFTLEILLFVIMNVLLKIPHYLLLKIGTVWFLILLVYRHYKIESTLVWEEINRLYKSFIYYCLFSIAMMYPKFEYIFEIVLIGLFMAVGTLLIDRTFRIIFRNIISRKTLIIGTNYDAYRIGKIAHNNRFALTDVKGFIKLDTEEVCNELIQNDKLNVYKYEDLLNVIKEKNIDQIIISLDNNRKEVLDRISRTLQGKVRYIKIAPKLNFTMTFNSKINDFDGVLLISTSRGVMGKGAAFVKRCIDICAGLAGCALLLPLTIYVRHKNKKNGDNDPIFFTQERIGLNGKPIKIYKYRSMIPNAEQVLEELMEKDPLIKEEYLTNKKLINDPRITEAGKFLRRTSLDEFPQFINVLKGEMSFVGPRPYLPREEEDMDIYYDSIIKCKPGITGMWQANGRSDVGFIDRCKLDDYYYRNWSIGLDMIIIYKTVKSVFYGKGAL